ncbi:MAG: DUF2812 domain-containing protein [Anaerolineaceae bacterium]|nr:DUF2812 domain-containing protein [Anaerolineaceae bacterium]
MIKAAFFMFDLDREERWLNAMLQKGHSLKQVHAPFYIFQPLESSQAIKPICLDVHTFKRRADFEDYLAFMEDSGWDFVSGGLSKGVQYFARRDGDKNALLFSDLSSQMNRYRKLAVFWFKILIFYLVFCLGIWLATENGSMSFGSWWLPPQQWFRTAGLWEKHGIEFWTAFLREFPLAIFSGLSQYLTMFMPLISGVLGITAWLKYRKGCSSKQN